MGNDLIGGTEHSEDKVWPSDWLCELCGKPLKDHIREPDDDFPYTNWCYEDYVSDKNTWRFAPVDNLSYVEAIAKERKI